jgi:hypothetical protein
LESVIRKLDATYLWLTAERKARIYGNLKR